MKQNKFFEKRVVLFVLLATISAIFVACNTQTQIKGNFAQIPAGQAFAEGKEIFFSHTETSDPEIAKLLTDMMKSPVLYVPSLANVPEASTSKVYVFENGLTGHGPLGFQADVFDNPPGTEGYTPLRRVVLVKWADGVVVSELKSLADIQQAEANNLLTTSETEIVINMPFIVWDGGKR